MSHAIDGLLQWLKWPAALWFAVSIPQLLVADFALIRNALRADLAPFWLGLLAYLTVWWLVLRHRLWGQFLSTLLHELTHAIFAILTRLNTDPISPYDDGKDTISSGHLQFQVHENFKRQG